jgi:hypothetical membrane protein
MTGAQSPTTRLLLRCGAVAGPLFVLVVLGQDYTRPGFDPRIHLLSLLSLGDFGWIQVANFVGAGVLNVLYAIGLRRRLQPGRAAAAAPILITIYGIGLIAVGFFTTDPNLGYPPGAVTPTGPTPHGAIHALGGLVIFLSLAGALLAFGRRFWSRGDRGWALYVVLTAILLLAVFFGTISNSEWMARGLRLGTLVGWLAASAVAVQLLGSSEPASRRAPS